MAGDAMEVQAQVGWVPSQKFSARYVAQLVRQQHFGTGVAA